MLIELASHTFCKLFTCKMLGDGIALSSPFYKTNQMEFVMDQNSYVFEIQERCSKDDTVDKLSGVNPLDHVAIVSAETSYRRGYFQGFFAALECMQQSNKLPDIEQFLYKNLFRWRYSKHNGSFECPPEMK